LVVLAQDLLQRRPQEVLEAFLAGTQVLLEVDLKLSLLAAVVEDLLLLHPVFLVALAVVHQIRQRLLGPEIHLQHLQAKVIRAEMRLLMAAAAAGVREQLVVTQMLLGHLEARAAQDLIHCQRGQLQHQLVLAGITLAAAVAVLKTPLLIQAALVVLEAVDKALQPELAPLMQQQIQVAAAAAEAVDLLLQTAQMALMES
jgi:hypothetical protein